MNTPKESNETPKYQGNEIPIAIKIAWVVFVVWLIYYMVKFAFPDLSNWI